MAGIHRQHVDRPFGRRDAEEDQGDHHPAEAEEEPLPLPAREAPPAHHEGGGEEERPGEELARHHGQVVVPGGEVVPGLGVAGDVLAEDDLPQVVGPRGEPGGDQPGEHHGRPEEEPPADPHPLELRGVAGEEQERHHRQQRRQQAHGSLGQGGEPGAEEEEEVEAGTLLGPGAHPEPDAEGHERGEQHVDLPEPPLPEDLEAGGEGRGRQPSGAAAEQSLADAKDEQQAADGGEGRGEARGGLVEAAAPPGNPAEKGDRPEEERRLLAVDPTVQVGHGPVAEGAHLPGHLGVAGLVRVPHVAEAQPGQEEHGPEQGKNEQVAAEGFQSVASALCGVCGGCGR